MSGNAGFIEGPPGRPLLREVDDVNGLLERCFSEQARGVLLYAENLPPLFFDLSSGQAGAVLQKFRNYGVRLAVVCPPDTRLSRRFPLVIEEEHRKPHFRVVRDRDAAREWLAEPDPRERVRQHIRRAFANTPRPDNSRLRDSVEGDEPHLVERDFADKHDWRTLEPTFLDWAPDGFASALSFFSREAFRYFLPAYLLADLDDRLDRAYTLFHLWHGFDDKTSTDKVNPRRYGDLTWRDAQTEKFALFTLEEVEAIVAFLEFKAPQEQCDEPEIRQALLNYWYPRLLRP